MGKMQKLGKWMDKESEVDGNGCDRMATNGCVSDRLSSVGMDGWTSNESIQNFVNGMHKFNETIWVTLTRFCASAKWT